MKTALVIAYHFPPAGGLGAAGSQRAMKIARHLPAGGWRPLVLTVRESSYESFLTMDPALLEQVAPDQFIVRTTVWHGLAPVLQAKASISNGLRRLFGRERVDHPDVAQQEGEAADTSVERSLFQKVKDAITDLFEIPDEVAGWLIPALFAGVRTVRREQVDVIFATGRPWTTLVIGAVLKAITRKPLVVDFRDPWMTNPFRLKYSGLKDSIEARLERWVVRSADIVVANTDYLRDEFVERFGSAVEEKCITVLNGFDPEEFAKVEPELREGSRQTSFLMVHPGFLYGKRDPRILVDAIALLRDRGLIEPGEFICELIGPVELSYDLESLIRSLELEDLITLRGPVSYRESLSALASCDVALLLQPGTSTQIPSKLFEYVGFGKTIIAVAPLDSSVAKIIDANNLGVVTSSEDTNAVAEAILAAVCQWRETGHSVAIPEQVQVEFDVRRSVQKLADAMSKLVDSRV